jgi:hypothetical protein
VWGFDLYSLCCGGEIGISTSSSHIFKRFISTGHIVAQCNVMEGAANLDHHTF